MTTVNFNMRLEKELKDETSQIFENYGMTTAQAVRMFLVHVAKTKKVPLSFDYQADDLSLSQTLCNCL
ncbi:type II toxin-antitoxin system RelB/DinJ family antitoxin [Psychrobacter ciconiae]|uniref:type II toxin-antitoxin system RelB/DinJ family antitoxin n=1 Tax=Psychrobacter ciconiae TaxID=1553449 RepID=UPI0019181B2A|nr:type II toxin-antitoxin system RelB/DinJ family antitoxin [Psychrobacter ciconiae]